MNAVPLGELGDIVSGSTPKTHVADYWNGDIPWVTPADLSAQEGIYFHGSPKRITQKGLESCSAKILPPGSILFSSRAPIGHSAVTRIPLCTNQGFKSIVPNKRLHPVYGYFALKFITPLIVAQGRGATFAEVNKEIMEEVQVPYRDIAEQRRIARLLEQADSLRRTRRHALELSDTFIPSIFIEFFGEPLSNPRGWPWSELVDICEKVTDGTHFSPPEVAKGIPYVTAKNIKQDGIDLSNLTYVSEQHHREIYSRCDPRPGDVLYIKDGATTGIATVNRLRFEFSMLSSLALLRPKASYVTPEYLVGYLNARSVHEWITSQMKGGAIKRLTIERIKELPILVPDLAKQQKFAALVERHEHLRATQREALRQAEHLFQTLLHQAFSEGV